MNIGIFGGTFNPVHNGHLMIAQYAVERCSLDKVLFMTSATPPHKDLDMTNAETRHRLVEAAVCGYDRFCAFDFEIEKGGISYTSDTLTVLKHKYPRDRLFFIMGADSLRDFSTWHEPETISRLATLIVYPRHGVDIVSAAAAAREEYEADIKILNAPIMEISSTDIRNRVREGLPVDFFIPSSVKDMIKKDKLYV